MHAHTVDCSFWGFLCVVFFLHHMTNLLTTSLIEIEEKSNLAPLHFKVL